MARRPYEPQPWLREAIVASRTHYLETLAAASERFAEHHRVRPGAGQQRAADYREQAAEFERWALAADLPPLDLTATDLWSALYRAKADEDLMDQVADLDRRHSRPGQPCRFRLDEHDELHLQPTRHERTPA